LVQHFSDAGTCGFGLYIRYDREITRLLVAAKEAERAVGVALVLPQIHVDATSEAASDLVLHHVFCDGVGISFSSGSPCPSNRRLRCTGEVDDEGLSTPRFFFYDACGRLSRAFPAAKIPLRRFFYLRAIHRPGEG